MKSSRMIMVVVLLVGATQLFALSGRTFVSAQLGNDANGCSPTSPCRGFARAISLTSPAGEVVVLDSGGYGGFTVSTSITIQAPSGVYAGCTTGGGVGATIINASGTDVVILRGLLFNGLGTGSTGVVQVGGAVLHIENCTINGYAGNGVDASAVGGTVFINDTTIRNNGSNGVQAANSTVTVNHCRLEKNGLAGVRAGDSSRVTVVDTLSAGNGTGYAVDAPGGAAALTVENSVASGNSTGVSSGSVISSIARVSNTVVTANTTGIQASGTGQLLSRLNNMVEGNGTDGTFTGTMAAK